MCVQMAEMSCFYRVSELSFRGRVWISREAQSRANAPLHQEVPDVVVQAPRGGVLVMPNWDPWGGPRTRWRDISQLARGCLSIPAEKLVGVTRDRIHRFFAAGIPAPATQIKISSKRWKELFICFVVVDFVNYHLLVLHIIHQGLIQVYKDVQKCNFSLSISHSHMNIL